MTSKAPKRPSSRNTGRRRKAGVPRRETVAELAYLDRHYELVVVGGGIGGCLTAITAARKGLKTALVDNKAGLGGNACSDIGVSIDGATFFGFFANMREGGPVEELKEKLAEVDPYYRGTQTSGILLLWCEQEQVAVYSELNIHGVETAGRRVSAVKGSQSGTERNYRFTAEQFVDATGDGTVAALAGCDFMQGRESRRTFGEVLAPARADQGIMGASLLYRASERAEPSEFVRPSWAYEYQRAEDLPFRLWEHGKPPAVGFWWIEYAGDHGDPLGEYESIRKELLKCLYGVWAFFKNDPARGMEKYALDSVSIAPAKRESRRIVGDHVMTERDIVERTSFPDAVAYGGWNIDIHVPGGFKSRLKPNIHAFFPWVFTFPLRSLYAKDMDNLWLVGRDMSVSHVALGATRLQATIGATGHAVGIAAAVAQRRGLTARAVAGEWVGEVQQEILKDGSFIPGVRNTDPADHARTATVTATSEARLAFTSSEEWLPVGRGRALSFPVTEGRVDRIELPLKNNGALPVEVSLFFSACEHPNHFTHRSPLAHTRVKMAPGAIGAVFEVGAADLAAGLYAVLVMAEGDVAWRRSGCEPYGAYTAIYNPERYFTPSRDTRENLYAVQKTMMVTKDAKPVEWIRERLYRAGYLGRPIERAQPKLPSASITPTQRPYAPANVVSGVSHTDLLPDLWISDPAQPLPQELTLVLATKPRVSSVRLVFDTDLDMPHPAVMPVEVLAKKYTVALRTPSGWRTVVRCDENRSRFRVHAFAACKADAVKLTIEEVHAGGKSARVFEVRCYE